MIGKKINQLATELAPVSTDLTIIGDPTTGVSKKITLAQLGAIFSGAVSFYTNLAGFPATGDINVIYCAKDTQKLYLWNGSAYTEVFPSQALLDTYQLRSEKGVSNGYASLDSGGKVPISQLPSSIMEYKGTWNAATNTPTLANGTGDTGDVYICNVAGTVNFGAGPITFAVGDYTIYSGSIWQRSSGAVGTVTSVAVSRSGDALAITGSPITTSGTINLGFAGNSTQYINGAGNLVTFPGVINEAQNLITEVYNKTGATLTKGTVVYINGGQGNLPAVTKALATGDSTSAQTYGIVRNDITNNNNGYVVVAGRISDLDTQAFTEGTQLYLSPTTAGAYTSTKPYAPNHLVYVGIVVRAHPTQGVVEVKIQNGYEMDELHNVAAQTPSNNDGLFWEASTSLWKNKSIATILGGTPITGSGNVNAIPKFTANSVLGNSVMEDDGNFVSMRGLKLNASAGVGNTINFQQASGITAAGLGYSTIGAAGSTGIQFYLDQNVTERIFIFDTATITSNTARTYSMPDSSGTLALVSQLTGGTVTSVGLSSATSGVTIGSTPITTSGTITLAIATASGSQQGLLSSTDWTTFNNKQNALTNPVTGTGTTNYLPKFTGTSTIGNSIVQDNSTGIIVNGTDNFTSQNGGWFFNGSGSYTSGIFASSSSNNLTIRTPQTMSFESGGALRMTLNASGNVGIGTTSPTTLLELNRASTGSSMGMFITNSAGSTLNNSSDIWFGNWGGASISSIYNARISALNTDASSARTDLLFYTYGGTGAGSVLERMRITSGGQLLIGTTSSSGVDKVRVNNDGTTSYSTVNITNANSTANMYVGVGGSSVANSSLQNNAYVWNAAASSLVFGTSDTERMRITSGGSVLLGTTTNQNDVRLQVAASGGAGSWISGTFAGVGSTDKVVIGNLSSYGAMIGGHNSALNAWADLYISGTNLIFGSDGTTERARITSGGQLLVGTTSHGDGSMFQTSSITSLNAYRQTTTGASGIIGFYSDVYSTKGVVAYFKCDGGLVNYSANNVNLSDERMKNSIKLIESYWDKFKAIQIVKYKYNGQNHDDYNIGVIAQQVEKVAPEFISNEGFGVNNTNDLKSVYESDLHHTTIKVLQEAMAKIETLEKELDTLKNK